MTGFVGGTVTGNALQSLVCELHHEPWYERETVEERGVGIGFCHHGSKDPRGHTTWQGNGRAGIVHGAISNLDEREIAPVFERVLDDPAVLATLDGPFVIVCFDTHERRMVVATDKLGTRPCYFAHDGRLLVSSSLDALLPALDDPVLDEQAASDMLFLGNVWGERTLLESVTALPPATVLEYTDDGVTTERYWKPEYSAAPRQGYNAALISRYRRTMADVSTTIEGEIGIWLSGGLDSRAMAAALNRHAGRAFDSLTAYTYDANPRGGGNPEIAARVASSLGVDISEVELTPETFLDTIERSIDLTDGMLRWPSLLNLSAVFSLPDDHAGVLVEASGLGELIGQHPRRYHFERCDTVAEALVRSEAITDERTVKALLAPAVGPRESFHESIRKSTERTFERTLLDVNYTNYYSRMAFASDKLMRSQAGTRVPLAQGNFLEHTARLPLDYRMRTFPGTNGKIPYGMTRPKHALAKSLDNGLDRIPYERTGLKPTRPFSAQVAGFVCKTGLARLRSEIAYGGARTPDVWYHVHDGLRAYLDGLLDDACTRRLFDADEIRRLQGEHLRGETHHMTTTLGALTTLEHWLQTRLD